MTARDVPVISDPDEPVKRDATAPPSPRGRRTRARLLKAATAAFPKYGYAATNATLISAEAGVSYGSFYVYFASKEEIFAEAVAAVFLELDVAIRAPHGLSLTERLAYENARFFEWYRDNARMWQLIEEVSRTNAEFNTEWKRMRHEYVGRLASSLRGMQKAGEIDDSLDAFYLANVLGSMAERLAWLAAVDDDLDQDALLATLNEVWLRSIGIIDRV